MISFLHCLEFVARVQHHYCGYVDKLSDKRLSVSAPSRVVCLQILVQMYLTVSMQRELSLNFHRNNVYWQLAVYANYIGSSVVTRDRCKFWRVPYMWWKNYWKWPMCHKNNWHTLNWSKFAKPSWVKFESESRHMF